MEIIHKVQQLKHTHTKIQSNRKKKNKKEKKIKENKIKSTGTQKVNGTINMVEIFLIYIGLKTEEGWFYFPPRLTYGTTLPVGIF